MWQENRHVPIPVFNLVHDLVVRVMLLLLVYVMQLTFEPHHRQVTEAELLTLYKRPRRDSLVPPWLTITVVIMLPLVAIAVPLTNNHDETAKAFLTWTLALAINAAVTELLKLSVGRLRPDFFYRCFPDGRMTADLHCTGQAHDVLEGRKSFPSGHSSFAFCSLGFLSLWACEKLEVISQRRGGRGWRRCACVLPLLIAGGVAISRCYDNHHHWEDVIAGSLLGFIIALFCYNQNYNGFCINVGQFLRRNREIAGDSLQASVCTSQRSVESTVANTKLKMFSSYHQSSL